MSMMNLEVMKVVILKKSMQLGEMGKKFMLKIFLIKSIKQKILKMVKLLKMMFL